MFKRLALLALPLVLVGGLLSLPSGAAAPLGGPDVSRWQHGNGQPIDWQAVRRSGQSFAFIKATGTSGVDPWFTREWPAARAAGLVTGAYHYADPSTSADAQAGLVVHAVGSTRESGDLGIVLDLESTGGLGPRALVAWAHAFLSGVERRTGRTPLLYTYPAFWHESMADDRSFGAYPLWLARYSSREPAPLPGWTQWTFWQHTSTDRLPGIPGYVDHNVMCCTVGTLVALADGRSRALARLWRQLGGASGSLGLPLGPEQAVPGGWGQTFQRGYGATTTHGTYAVTGPAWDRYRALGAGTGVLGVPVGSLARGQQLFMGGRIVLNGAVAHALRGSVLVRWLKDEARVGLPTGEQIGPAQQFVDGGLYVTPTGVHLVPGAIRDRYESLGGASSALGLPTSDAVATAGGLTVVSFDVGQLTEAVVGGQTVVA